MSKRKKVQSVHDRDLKAIREARDRSSIVLKPEKQEKVPDKIIEAEAVDFTFNWRDETRPMLVPRLVSEGKKESLRRELTNSVARGESSSNLDKRVLAILTAEEMQQDILDGIGRWHTYPNSSKER